MASPPTITFLRHDQEAAPRKRPLYSYQEISMLRWHDQFGPMHADRLSAEYSKWYPNPNTRSGKYGWQGTPKLILYALASAGLLKFDRASLIASITDSGRALLAAHARGEVDTKPWQDVKRARSRLSFGKQ